MFFRRIGKSVTNRGAQKWCTSAQASLKRTHLERIEAILRTNSWERKHEPSVDAGQKWLQEVGLR